VTKSPAEIIAELLCKEAAIAPLTGRYSRVESLAVPHPGAFSIVLSAHDDLRRQSVILKVLSPSADPYRSDCFRREVQVSEALVGRDHIIQLTGGLEQLSIPLAHAATGMIIPFPVQFFALERARETFTGYLFGGSRIKPVYRRLLVLRDVVKGVARLHRTGYCHRDIKPDNVLLFSRGVAKIADLGTCRLWSGLDPIATNYIMPVGDLMYAAPEMFFAAGLDADNFIAADWFSVGAMMFEAVTGQLLYVAIGLRNRKEIVQSLGAVADIKEYEKRVERTAGRYPIPRTNEFSEPWLSPLSSGTHGAISSLIRDLCNFKYKARLRDFDAILRRLDAAIIRSRRDVEKRARRGVI
jgi:serine/threonine protein kinase